MKYAGLGTNASIIQPVATGGGDGARPLHVLLTRAGLLRQPPLLPLSQQLCSDGAYSHITQTSFAVHCAQQASADAACCFPVSALSQFPQSFVPVPAQAENRRKGLKRPASAPKHKNAIQNRFAMGEPYGRLTAPGGPGQLHAAEAHAVGGDASSRSPSSSGVAMPRIMVVAQQGNYYWNPAGFF
jgi:hypothetical protein